MCSPLLLQVVLIVAFSLIYVAVLLPAVRHANAGLKCTRGMLLFFPGEVATGVDALKTYMRNFSRRNCT